MRTNVGLAARSEAGDWRYVCPSAWQGLESALSVSDPTGEVVVVSGGREVQVSLDGGQSFEPIEQLRGLAAALLWSGDRAWGLRASPSGSWLWSWAPGEAAEQWPLGVQIADGLSVDEQGVLWLAGARPTPWAGWWDGELQAVPVPEETLDRLTPRGAGGERVTLFAGDGTWRRLWEVEHGELVDGTDFGGVVLGPVRSDGERWAVVDGVLWRDGSGAWQPTEREVDWTCLQQGERVVWACSLRGVLAVTELGASLGVERLAFGLEQLGPHESGPLATTCALDWAHFGGESGWLETAPAACPGEARGPWVAPEPEGCGCAHGGSGWAWALVLGGWRRKARRR